jgi:predicted cupin superfamily sugar epimerase
MNPRVQTLIATLDLRPHPEGGFYREVYRSPTTVMPADGRGPRASLTSILFLLPAGRYSRWHRVLSDEVWHLYEGGPLELLELTPQAWELSHHHLTHSSTGAPSPVYSVVAGNWQAARLTGDYALVGCTVAPGFEFSDFALLVDHPHEAEIVRQLWPDAATLI